MRTRKIILVIFIACFIIVMLLYFCYWYMIKCEGQWFGEPMERSMDLGEIKRNLLSYVEFIQKLGPRNSADEVSYRRLQQCRNWIIKEWESMGYEVEEDTFSVGGREYANLIVEIRGQRRPGEIVIVSAQYDTHPGSPGANNNGSGMAVLFELSRLFSNRSSLFGRTLRLIEFVNEQYPFFGTENMGSYRYAKRCREKNENILVMISLDTVGYYTDKPKSQKLPFPFSLFYPDRGISLAFIGNLTSRSYVVKITAGFKKGSAFPINAGVAPECVEGVTWSDHSSFWKFGYPALQVTDTGKFRSPYHNTSEDTMEKLDFDAMSRIVIGMYAAILDLVEAK